MCGIRAIQKLRHEHEGNSQWSKKKAQHTLVADVQFNQKVDRGSQIWKHIRTQREATKQLTKDLKDKVTIAAQYQAYKHPFIEMLLQLDLM